MNKEKKYFFWLKIHSNACCLCLPLGSSLPYICFSHKEPLRSYCQETVLWYLKMVLTSKIPCIQLKHWGDSNPWLTRCWEYSWPNASAPQLLPWDSGQWTTRTSTLNRICFFFFLLREQIMFHSHNRND